MAPAPDILALGSQRRESLLLPKLASGVAAILWFICLSSSPTVTMASAVNQRSFKGTANLNHHAKESGGQGSNIQLQ